MVVINAKEIYCFEVRPLKKFLCKAGWFAVTCNQRLPLTLKETVQANINLFIFRAEFVGKKYIFDEHWVFIFSAKILVGNEF